MSTYAIGDVQGCFDELMELLRVINFDQERDTLWFVGDLVNRGPKSLQVLRFVKQLPHKVVVLGNHDLHLLSIYHKRDILQKSHTLDAVISAPDAEELIDWLRRQPLFYHDEKLNYVLVHAGIYPWWSLKQAAKHAHEVEVVLRGDNYVDFLPHMYGNEPDQWNEELCGIERLRFITNAFVRMRFASLDGRLDFVAAGPSDKAPQDFMPWYKIPERKTRAEKIIFGHWAALNGNVDEKNVYALDTGCVWGNILTAMRVEDEQMFSVPAINVPKSCVVD